MKFLSKNYKRKIPAKRIALLRKAIESRKELEKISRQAKRKNGYSGKLLAEKIACYDIPQIDYFHRLKDNEYLKIYGKRFVSHIKEYIALIDQKNFQKAIELNQDYFK